ncbi:UDP-4-amino-4,6-dideoxy-N-acetyl-beta-L-altrosamine N-acetyltransferase [Arsukibacterium indicum]|uniref:UDP-4-amino-4, 6-dideoxy-N-acetyl-beta-L-altrosamine N-acetyltransferase n=1 Tax=Arsukibacterium indicum TaxID=2848612 RepID=A0ABS6MGK0_9GAMM|nr:UDP-4-amino-4,6-dideoxy-N-acetyl-beta-L-altrosamine N-acetyltransferase [Arsukibacterium indicum]MBV2127870.1 UDP-4-amino-4,6-dideoxy-N-acetyl-beta-L-altrosamine N-acetyltransferase [Arsukibacterium indicum]
MSPNLSNKVYPRSTFSRLQQAELAQLWHWRNQPSIRQNMHNSKEISWPEHQAWFAQLPDSGKTFYIFRQNERPIGALYFDPVGDCGLEWGCYLGETDVWPGSGLMLEIAALDYAAAKPGISFLHAEVLSFNQSVINMHRLFGYQGCEDKPCGGQSATSEAQHSEHCVKVFQYKTADWRAKRSQILAKLPKQISAAAEFIDFQD